MVSAVKVFFSQQYIGFITLAYIPPSRNNSGVQVLFLISCVIKGHAYLRSSVLCLPTALLGSASAGLGSSLGGAVPGGQPSAPSLNPPSQIDPSSIERAYAALGLTYQGNQLQAQPAQPNMPNQGLQGQPGMRPLNPMGKLGRRLLKSG